MYCNLVAIAKVARGNVHHADAKRVSKQRRCRKRLMYSCFSRRNLLTCAGDPLPLQHYMLRKANIRGANSSTDKRSSNSSSYSSPALCRALKSCELAHLSESAVANGHFIYIYHRPFPGQSKSGYISEYQNSTKHKKLNNTNAITVNMQTL